MRCGCSGRRRRGGRPAAHGDGPEDRLATCCRDARSVFALCVSSGVFLQRRLVVAVGAMLWAEREVKGPNESWVPESLTESLSPCSLGGRTGGLADGCWLLAAGCCWLPATWPRRGAEQSTERCQILLTARPRSLFCRDTAGLGGAGERRLAAPSRRSGCRKSASVAGAHGACSSSLGAAAARAATLLTASRLCRLLSRRPPPPRLPSGYSARRRPRRYFSHGFNSQFRGCEGRSAQRAGIIIKDTAVLPGCECACVCACERGMREGAGEREERERGIGVYAYPSTTRMPSANLSFFLRRRFLLISPVLMTRGHGSWRPTPA